MVKGQDLGEVGLGTGAVGVGGVYARIDNGLFQSLFLYSLVQKLGKIL